MNSHDREPRVALPAVVWRTMAVAFFTMFMAAGFDSVKKAEEHGYAQFIADSVTQTQKRLHELDLLSETAPFENKDALDDQAIEVLRDLRRSFQFEDAALLLDRDVAAALMSMLDQFAPNYSNQEVKDRTNAETGRLAETVARWLLIHRFHASEAAARGVADLLTSLLILLSLLAPTVYANYKAHWGILLPKRKRKFVTVADTAHTWKRLEVVEPEEDEPATQDPARRQSHF